MADVDPVAAYEGGVVGCHGAPQRECCVRAGMAAYVRAMRDRVTAAITAAYAQRVRDRVNASPDDHAKAFADAAIEALVGAWPAPTPTPAPEADRAPAITTAGAAIITAALQWRDRIVDPPNMWADDQDLALIAAVDAYRAEPKVDYPDQPAAEVVHPAAPTLRTPAEWLTQPEYAGTEILDHDGWRDRPWTDLITRDEFRRRLYQCTITAPVPEGWGAMLRHGTAEAIYDGHYDDQEAGP